MAEVPQEALQAAADAHERWYLDHGGDPDRCYRESHEKWSKATLEAVWPLLAAQVRRDLLAALKPVLAHDDNTFACRLHAARQEALSLCQRRRPERDDPCPACTALDQIGEADAH